MRRFWCKWHGDPDGYIARHLQKRVEKIGGTDFEISVGYRSKLTASWFGSNEYRVKFEKAFKTAKANAVRHVHSLTRRLEKTENFAADTRGNENQRLVAVEMAGSIRKRLEGWRS